MRLLLPVCILIAVLSPIASAQQLLGEKCRYFDANDNYIGRVELTCAGAEVITGTIVGAASKQCSVMECSLNFWCGQSSGSNRTYGLSCGSNHVPLYESCVTDTFMYLLGYANENRDSTDPENCEAQNTCCEDNNNCETKGQVKWCEPYEVQ